MSSPTQDGPEGVTGPGMGGWGKGRPSLSTLGGRVDSTLVPALITIYIALVLGILTSGVGDRQ